jgi:hypothetical protein
MNVFFAKLLRSYLSRYLAGPIVLSFSAFEMSSSVSCNSIPTTASTESIENFGSYEKERLRKAILRSMEI